MVMPATKRCETRRPREELSGDLRKGLLVERLIKKERGMQGIAQDTSGVDVVMGLWAGSPLPSALSLYEIRDDEEGADDGDRVLGDGRGKILAKGGGEFAAECGSAVGADDGSDGAEEKAEPE